MAALAVELGSFIERSVGVRSQNSEFFVETEVVQFCSGLIWSSFGRDAPFEAEIYPHILSLSDSLRQYGVISFVSMSEPLIMVVETGFKFRLQQP